MGSNRAEQLELLYKRNRHHELVDSLSFADAVPLELEGAIKELIESEKRIILEEYGGNEDQLLDSYIESLPPTPDHTDSGHIYHEAIRRKTNGESLLTLDMDRYSNYGEGKSVDDRTDHMKMLSEYVQGTQVNLELMDRYKEAAWLKYLEDLTKMHSSIDKIKTQLNSEIDQLNKERRLKNVEWGNRLHSIQQEHADYEKKNVQLMLAIEKLQNTQQAGTVDY